jgi:hypothetical protein
MAPEVDGLSSALRARIAAPLSAYVLTQPVANRTAGSDLSWRYAAAFVVCAYWMLRKDGDKEFYVLNGEHVQRSRLRLDTRKWLLSKALPKSGHSQAPNQRAPWTIPDLPDKTRQMSPIRFAH